MIDILFIEMCHPVWLWVAVTFGAYLTVNIIGYLVVSAYNNWG